MGRLSRILLGLLSAYAAVVLTLAASRTVHVQHDAAYYCEVAERFSEGHGLTSLCDRRGPADPGTFPQSYQGATAWPFLLGCLTVITGDAETTGTALNILGLLGSLVLGSLCLNRYLRVPGVVAVLCTGAAVLHRDSVGTAILPLTDSLSLFATIATVTAMLAKRVGWSILFAVMAVLMRYQNAVLLLPLLWVLAPGGSRRFCLSLVIGAVVAALAVGRENIWQGLAVFIDPTHRDSLWRGLRFLSIPLLIGVVFWRREPRLAPLGLLGLGHVLVLLCFPDPSSSREWLFAQRHGLPLHFVAAAVAGVTVTRSRGLVYWLSLLAVLVSFGESVRRPARALQSQPEITSRPDLVMAERYLRNRPLPEGSIVLSQDADFLAYRLGLQTVHLRGFEPDPPVPFLEHLPTRSITHALLTWEEKPVSMHATRRLQEFALVLRPHAVVVAEEEDIVHRSRFILLRLDP